MVVPPTMVEPVIVVVPVIVPMIPDIASLVVSPIAPLIPIWNAVGPMMGPVALTPSFATAALAGSRSGSVVGTGPVVGTGSVIGTGPVVGSWSIRPRPNLLAPASFARSARPVGSVSRPLRTSAAFARPHVGSTGPVSFTRSELLSTAGASSRPILGYVTDPRPCAAAAGKSGWVLMQELGRSTTRQSASGTCSCSAARAEAGTRSTATVQIKKIAEVTGGGPPSRPVSDAAGHI